MASIEVPSEDMKRALFSLLIILSFSSQSLFAQLGWWTWMKGSGLVPPNQTAAGSYGTMGVAASANTPPGLYEACEWTDATGKFWIYGGSNGSPGAGYYSALWMFDPATNNWTWVNGSSTAGLAPVYGVQGVPAAANNPGARAWGISTWADTQGNLWLFGGATSAGWYSDLWRYNIASDMWTWMNGPNTINQPGVYGTQGVGNAANYPRSRSETNATWVDNSGNLWLFGGHAFVSGGPAGNFDHTLNDLWKYDPGTNQWTWMKGSNTVNSAGSYGAPGTPAATNEPRARCVYSKWKDSNGNFWLFGGLTDSNDLLNDMWKYEVVSNNWTWVRGSNQKNPSITMPAKCQTAPGNDPPARQESRACWTDKCGNFWMFGGTNIVGNSNDLWHYDVPTNQWTFVNGNAAGSFGTLNTPAAANLPSPRFGSIPFKQNNGDLWFFGGMITLSFKNDMWRYVIDTTCVPWCSTTPQNPTAGFTGANLSGCAPLTVTFTNTSQNSSSWNWNFGDGSTSTQQHPVHTYTASGVYTVTLVATSPPNSDTLVQTNYVTVFPSATAAFTASTNPVCLGQTMTFTNGSSGASSYSWNFGDGTSPSSVTDPTHTYAAAGNYTVTLIAVNSNGCNDTIAIPVSVMNNISVTQNPVICTGSNYTLPGGNVVSTAGTYMDTLSSSGGCDSIITTNLSINAFVTGSQNPVICAGASFTLPGGSIVSAGGTYVDTLTAQAGCDSIITTTLTVNPAMIVNQSASICTGASYTLPGGAVVSVSGTYTDTLSTGAGCDSIVITALSVVSTLTSSQNPVICIGTVFTLPGGSTTTVSGTFTDTLTSSGGCDSIITTNLTVNPNSVSTQTAVVCSGINFVLPGGATASVSGTYTDTLTAKNGCDSIVTTNLTVSLSPNVSVSANVTITAGSNTTLSASGGGSYSWSPAAGLNSTTGSVVIATPPTSMIYCVTVTNSDGCVDSACVSVAVEVTCGELYLPNAFSPNGDNENDDFHAYIHPSCVQDFKLVIYNRWGQKVFETEDVNQSWDGKFRGIMSNPALYVFYCRALMTNGKEVMKEGNVSLIR